MNPSRMFLALLSALGGALTPVPAAAAPEAPTFTRDIAPIIFQNCTTCHRSGQIAPFPLTNYAEVSRRAQGIALVTARRIMPPWKPREGHGEFTEARRLSAAQIALLDRWAKAGAPEGDPALLPALPRFRDGWQLGKPDIVLRLPRPAAIPAEGRDQYVHFVFPLAIDREIYVRGVEVRPGNPRVAHHAIGLLDSSGKARRLAQAAGGSYERFGGPGFVPAGLTPGFVPGQRPRLFKEGAAITIKRGTDFVLQVHYHPSGKPETDQTEVGLYLTPTPPTRHTLGALLGSEAIDIPAGADGFTVADSFVLPVAMKADAIWAHMHLLGKEVRVWAELPGGTTRRLLWISDWDFNWQDTYLYREPVDLPKGTVVRAQWRFDNSRANLRNPNDPPRRVRLGENSTDEMAGVWLGGEVSGSWDLFRLLAANVGHYLRLQSEGRKFRLAQPPVAAAALPGGEPPARAAR